jgi:hypothetical protein
LHAITHTMTHTEQLIILLDSNNINDLLNRQTKYFSRLINNIIINIYYWHNIIWYNNIVSDIILLE